MTWRKSNKAQSLGSALLFWLATCGGHHFQCRFGAVRVIPVGHDDREVTFINLIQPVNHVFVSDHDPPGGFSLLRRWIRVVKLHVALGGSWVAAGRVGLFQG